MNPALWIAIITQIMKLAPAVVQGIQVVHGDQIANKDKKTMAMDALGVATNAALGDLSGQNAQIAQAASSVASAAIDSAVAVQKATGSYQKATAIANAAMVGAAGAASIMGAVKTPVATPVSSTEPVSSVTAINAGQPSSVSPVPSVAVPAV